MNLASASVPSEPSAELGALIDDRFGSMEGLREEGEMAFFHGRRGLGTVKTMLKPIKSHLKIDLKSM